MSSSDLRHSGGYTGWYHGSHPMAPKEIPAGGSVEITAYWNWNRDIPKDWSVTAWGASGAVHVELLNSDIQTAHMPVAPAQSGGEDPAPAPAPEPAPTPDPEPEPTPAPEPSPSPSPDLIEKTTQQTAFDAEVAAYEPSSGSGGCTFGWTETHSRDTGSWNQIMKANCDNDENRFEFKVLMKNDEWATVQYEQFEQDQTTGAMISKTENTNKGCEQASFSDNYTWCTFELSKAEPIAAWIGAPGGWGQLGVRAPSCSGCNGGGCCWN